ncbi:MAG: hypothetical protein LBT10_00990 [Methanobrevibacter sp.]|nr:hypothetical protein [Methanobrevibacter sp.]
MLILQCPYFIEYKKYNQISYNSVSPFLNDLSYDDLMVYDHSYYFYPYYNILETLK